MIYMNEQNPVNMHTYLFHSSTVCALYANELQNEETEVYVTAVP